jgi:osmoprotectant transport system ATP-binding protein
MTGIKANNLCKRFNDHVVLDHVNLNVAAGEVHILLGLSGSGKTTLLRLIMGLTTADQGSIQIADHEIHESTHRDWVLRIGYVPQEGGLFPHLTAQQNVTLVASSLKWPKERIAQRFDEMLQLTAFDSSLLQLYPRELSGGQRQRVALMRAAFLDPKVMVLDEPLGALDPLLRFDLQNDLHEVFQRLKKTVLLVTHDLSEAAFFGESVTLLKDGKVEQSGSLSDLLERPANDYVKRFISVQRPVYVRGWP